jgi:hypothetical protein
MFHRLADQVLEAVHRRLRRERRERGGRIHGIAGDQFGDALAVTGEERVVQLVHDDHPLGIHADLAAIPMAPEDRPSHSLFEIGVGQHHEGIRAAELHRRLLQRLARRSGDSGASAL